jgi:DNA-binding transcriptional LysR family regulator
VTLWQLRTFVELARAGSVRGCAAALSVTEPSVSAAVAHLQKELGAKLVERQGRGLRLTAAGEELARHAAQVLGAVDRTRRAVQEVGGGLGHLRLAVVTTAGEYVLPPRLKTYLEAHPQVQVSLEVGNRFTVIDKLLSREADLGVGGRPPHGSGITGVEFQENPLVVVGRAGHPLAAVRSVAPSRLASETWLRREEGSGTGKATEDFLADSGLEPTSVLTAGSNGAIKGAVAVGLGVALISRDAVAAELAMGTLSLIRVRGTPVRRFWHLLFLEDVPLPGSARAFRDLLRPQLGGAI